MTIYWQTLYCLCNKYQWFTSGDSYQYEKLYEFNENGASVHDLALIIYICSTGVNLKEIEEILEENKDETL